MVQEQQRLSAAERANLVAFLDGELNEAEVRAIATKLTQSVSARRELEALEKTWELLDHLPRPQTSTDFTSRTLSHVNQLAQRHHRLFKLADIAARRFLSVLVLVVSSLSTLGLAYVATRWVWPDPSAQLVRRLSMAEHIDEYLDAGSFAFLKLLDSSPEFNDQVSILPLEKTWGDPIENERRLRSMPRGRRIALSQNLERFNRLDPAAQASSQEIDDQLGQLESPDRTRFLSLLRSYHLWLQGLPQKKRQDLKTADDGTRLKLIAQYRSEALQQRTPRAEFLRTQFALVNQVYLFEAGRLLRVWFNHMSPDEKAQFDKNRTGELKRLRELARRMGIPSEEGLTPSEWDSIRGHLNETARLKKEKAKVQQKHLLEARYFLENEPKTVAPQKLLQFESALPRWFRENLVPLPPDAARRRLTILYRLVFEDAEMPDPPKQVRPATPPPSGPGTPPPAAPVGAPAANPAPF